MKFVLTNTSDVSVTVDGFGVLEPGASADVEGESLWHFTNMRGLAPSQVTLPEGVDVHVEVDAQESVAEGTEEA